MVMAAVEISTVWTHLELPCNKLDKELFNAATKNLRSSSGTGEQRFFGLTVGLRRPSPHGYCGGYLQNLGKKESRSSGRVGG
jgi:hypothetical protein